jgi:hypothetical protein
MVVQVLAAVYVAGATSKVDSRPLAGECLGQEMKEFGRSTRQRVQSTRREEIQRSVWRSGDSSVGLRWLPAKALVADFQYFTERRHPGAFSDFKTHPHFQLPCEVFSPGHLHFGYDDVSWVNPLLVSKKLRRGSLYLRKLKLDLRVIPGFCRPATTTFLGSSVREPGDEVWMVHWIFSRLLTRWADRTTGLLRVVLFPIRHTPLLSDLASRRVLALR